ncbi:MAG TPA: hypothetical protein VMT03_02280 [Polyangia bacterium]|nr:hypothetical protein [Polyangia bacterium]
MMLPTTVRRLVPLLVAAGWLGSGCDGSGKLTIDASTSGIGYSPAGVVVGPLDDHCSDHDGGQRMQEIGACQVLEKSSIPDNSSACGISFTTYPVTAPGDTDGGTLNVVGYGPTMYGSAANDDACRYFVSWVATPIQENADTYFTVTAIRLADGKPASCAGVRLDVSLSLTHAVPAPPDPAPEIAPGVYKVGPIRFDAPGDTPGHYWTVRFHLYEECTDTADSPHGHAAFYVSVP